MALLERDLPALLLQRVQDQALVAELVGDGALAGHLLEEGFKRLGVAPGEEAVEVADLAVQFVIAFGADGDHAVAAQGFDVHLQLPDDAVGDLLAVADVEGSEVFCEAGRDVDGGDHEGAEVVALARLVNTNPSNGGCHRLAK